MHEMDPYFSMVNRQTTAPYGVYGYGTAMPYAQQPQQQQQMMYPPQPAGAVIQGVTPQPQATDISNIPGMLPIEQSFIENILRLNKGKVGTFYYTYENNNEWNAKVYRGVIEAAGRDHIIISDPQTGKRYLLLMVNLDWVEFDEPINYTYTAAGAAR